MYKNYHKNNIHITYDKGQRYVRYNDTSKKSIIDKVETVQTIETEETNYVV